MTEQMMHVFSIMVKNSPSEPKLKEYKNERG